MRQIADRLEAERRGIERGGEAEPVGPKVMVAMSSNAETTRLLLRRASALAGKLNTNWYAVYVRTARDSPQRMSARDHRRLSENVTLAMELGAKVVWLSGEKVADELMRFAREEGVTLVLFGKSGRSKWLRPLRPSPIDAFVRLGTGIDVLEIDTARGRDALA
jgi:two-component system sensor histidine kinase KdpD